MEQRPNLDYFKKNGEDIGLQNPVMFWTNKPWKGREAAKPWGQRATVIFPGTEFLSFTSVFLQSDTFIVPHHKLDSFSVMVSSLLQLLTIKYMISKGDRLIIF